jgi:NAD(P)H-flavin reductase
MPPPAEPAAGEVLRPSPHRLARRHQETHDTWTLLLEPEGRPLEPFSPGQFAMLYAFGVGEAPISVSGARDDALTHTVRAVGSVTETLCALAVGDYVGVRGPFGRPWPVGDAHGKDVLVIAGGIGLAPLRPVILHVLENRDRYGGLCVMYGGRSPQELLYLTELERWRARFDVDLDVTVDGAPAGWRGRVGVVTTLIERAEFDRARTHAFVCGPEVMMRFAVTALRDAGLADRCISLSMERSMKCAVGHCGHCQLRERFICKDGPVFSCEEIEPLMRVREL